LEETKPEILDDAKCIILDVFDRFLANGISPDNIDLQLEIRRDLKRFFYGIFERRPAIYPIIIDV
jgi:ribonuclease J